VKRALFCLAFGLGLSAPASAQFGGIVHDPILQAASLPQLISQVQQALNLVSMAKTNLTTLPNGLSLTNLQSRLSAVNALLAQAQSACRTAATSSSCNIAASVATTQAATLPSELTQMQNLQNVANGTIGGLQGQQAMAAAIVQLQAAIQQLRQQVNANATQAAADRETATRVTTGVGIANPFAPEGPQK
jgi:hypothetical protein